MRRNSPSPTTDLSSSLLPTVEEFARSCRVSYGADDDYYPVAGKSVASVWRAFAGPSNIPADALPYIKGQVVPPGYFLAAGDHLAFLKLRGSKGVGEKVWDEKEFCQFFKITPEDLHAWIAQGLKVKRCVDGSIRITESAFDEFNRGKVIESPYLNTEQAAAYCNLTVKAFYARVERRKITPLPGSGKENLFTKEQCDRMMKGE